MNIERLSLDQLRVLVTVVDEGSFSAAARRLGRVQSAVTYTIQQLEQQLGVDLFDRSGYRPALTATGQSILQDAKVICSDPTRSSRRPGRALRDFDAAFPTVALQIQVEAMGAVAQHVYDGVADLAILCSLPFPPTDLTLITIGHVVLVPVAAPSHPLARHEGRIGDAVLREHRQIVLTDRSELSKGRDFGVYSPQTWRVSDLAASHSPPGVRVRVLAWTLAAFVVAASLVFHGFWAVPAEQFADQLTHFLKNAAILGGLLLLAYAKG